MCDQPFAYDEHGYPMLRPRPTDNRLFWGILGAGLLILSTLIFCLL